MAIADQYIFCNNDVNLENFYEYLKHIWVTECWLSCDRAVKPCIFRSTMTTVCAGHRTFSYTMMISGLKYMDQNLNIWYVWVTTLAALIVAHI